jgi:hypothetical protein
MPVYMYIKAYETYRATETATLIRVKFFFISQDVIGKRKLRYDIARRSGVNSVPASYSGDLWLRCLL